MTKNPSPTVDDFIEDEESLILDPGKHLGTIIRQWQWIAACSLGAGILVLAAVLLYNHLNPLYKSVALVASTASSSNINFGSSLTSTNDSQLTENNGNIHYEWGTTRLQSFVAQVQNGAIAEQVLGEVGPIIDEKGNPITAAQLMSTVKGELIKNTDTIRISVIYFDPVIAAEIANAWSRAYVQWINEIYSSSGITSRGTEAELIQAKTTYEMAESELEKFIFEDKSAEYKRKIDDYSSILPIGRKIGLFLDNALYMRKAVDAGGNSSAVSNALALTLLKTQIFAAYEGTNTLQVQNLPEALASNISTINAESMVADLDALISALQTYQSEIGIKTPEYEQNIRELSSLVAAQASIQRMLTDKRDLAWKTYSAIATKAADMRVNAQDNQMIFAASATPPVRSGASVKTAPLVAGGAGLVFGLIVAYVFEFWLSYNGHSPEKIIKRIFTFRRVTRVKKLDSLG